MSRKFFNLFAAVSMLVVLFSVAQPAFADGPVDLNTCTWGITMVKNEKTQVVSYVCATLFEKLAGKAVTYMGAETKKAVEKKQDLVKKVETYIQKDIDKNAPNLVPATCNIFQIIKGNTQYCTMPK